MVGIIIFVPFFQFFNRINIFTGRDNLVHILLIPTPEPDCQRIFTLMRVIPGHFIEFIERNRHVTRSFNDTAPADNHFLDPVFSLAELVPDIVDRIERVSITIILIILHLFIDVVKVCLVVHPLVFVFILRMRLNAIALSPANNGIRRNLQIERRHIPGHFVRHRL